MNITVKVSKTMTYLAQNSDGKENRTIRIKKDGTGALLLGSYVVLATKNNTTISLLVKETHVEDTDTINKQDDILIGYVTLDTFAFLDAESCCSIETVADVTLGCDPEVILVDRHDMSVVKANLLFKKQGQIGSDNWLLEFRPFPSVNEEVVTKNIGKLVEKVSDYFRESHKSIMMAGVSSYKSIVAGFHLHFGIPKPFLHASVDKTLKGILKVLDYYVGILAIIPEGRKDVYRRITPYLPYGKPSGFRVNNRTLEYRVPGGTLMKHPALANGILGIGGLVVEDVISRVKHVTNNFRDENVIKSSEDVTKLYDNIPCSEKLVSIICNNDIDPALEESKKILRDMEQMIGYKKREKSIERYVNVMRDNAITPDVEVNWR